MPPQRVADIARNPGEPIPLALAVQAQTSGKLASRSAAQQIDYWARIGRDIDEAPAINRRDIDRVLSGDQPYGILSEREQAIIRAQWKQDVERHITDLDFEAEFAARGREWVDADASGKLIQRGQTGE